jgi:hypothetical protein
LVTAIGLGKILDTEFDEAVVRDSDLRHQPLNDSVLAPLREDPKFGIGKSVERAAFCNCVGGQTPMY